MWQFAHRAAQSSMRVNAYGGAMAEKEEQSTGAQLIIGAIVLIQIAVSLEMMWLLPIAVVMFVAGVIAIAQKKQQSLMTTTLQEVNPYLPTSRGVDFLEQIVGLADNPDTAQMAIGAQPEGTHPMMEGVSAEEFAFLAQSYLGGQNEGGFARASSTSDFVREAYDEFAVHEHERVMPLGLANPVAAWSNPVDEWQNPTRYW